MIRYVVVRNNTESSGAIGKDTYGICACTYGGAVLDVVNLVYGISDDVVWLTSLADKLNLYGADPIHLHDIIEDELYKMRI